MNKLFSLHPLSYIRLIFIGIIISLYDSLPMSILSSGLIVLLLDATRLIPKKYVNILIVPFAFILYSSFSLKVNPESMVSFFICASILKIAQTQSNRDFFICILCSFFCLSGLLLFENSLFTMIYSVISILILISMIGLKSHKTISANVFKSSFKDMSLAVLISAPLVVILFIFFPRMNSFFPSINTANNGQIGYSPEIKNDNISSLSSSSQIAFRVSMKKVNQSDLYWRGSVLDLTDGFNWSRRHHYSTPRKQAVKKDGTNYEVTLNQNFKGDIFTLRNSNIKKSSVFLKPENRTLDNSFSYHMSNKKVSYIANTNFLPLTYNFSNKNYLQLPQKYKNKMILKIKEVKSIENLRQAIQTYIREKQFTYTLSPGLMVSLEDLIENKRGFCTHYASLISVILRQNKVPTRIVSGFQGGQYNEFGGYYIIRSNDAHAWIESYVGDRWHRIDPTAYISPDRIELGGEAFINPFPMSFALNLDRDSLKRNHLLKIYNKVKLYIDNKNVQFVSFFENFNRDYQQQLAKMLRIKLSTFYMLTLWGVLIIIFLIFMSFYIKKDKISFINKLEKQLRQKLQRKYPLYTGSMTLKKLESICNKDEKHILILISTYKYANIEIDLKELKKIIKKI